MDEWIQGNSATLAQATANWHDSSSAQVPHVNGFKSNTFANGPQAQPTKPSAAGARVSDAASLQASCYQAISAHLQAQSGTDDALWALSTMYAKIRDAFEKDDSAFGSGSPVSEEHWQAPDEFCRSVVTYKY